jgi:nucleoside phosphorylase
MHESLEIFCCYARRDQSLLLKLRTHLSSLEREGFIHIWHDKDISPGTEWEEEINKRLNTSHIILLLISPDFMASEYCYSKEMMRAIERHELGEARVIPILLRPVSWQGAPFGKLQVLPDNAQPVTTWRNRDEALLAVAQGIERVVKEWPMKRAGNSPFSPQTRDAMDNTQKILDKGIAASQWSSLPSAVVESNLSQPGVAVSRRSQMTEKLQKVDIAIITIREDEFEALLQRFRPTPDREPGRRTYGICHVNTKSGYHYTIAIARCSEQGNDTSQKLANDIIHDLNPQLLLVVGIAGGVPHDEFTLGDVIVSARIHNLNVGAQHEDGTSTFDIRGGIHPLISDITSNLLLYQDRLAGWNAPESIGQARPAVNPRRAIISGDEEWRRKVRASLKLHFDTEPNRTRLPRFKTGSIASSNHLIRNPLILNQWREIARTILAVEMESAGVYEAAQGIDRQYPVMAIRGISDIVGLKRDERWAAYACQTAAAFTYAFIMTEPIGSRSDLEHRSQPELLTPLQLARKAHQWTPDDARIRLQVEASPEILRQFPLTSETYEAWESGREKPPRAWFPYLTRVFKKPLSALFEWADEEAVQAEMRTPLQRYLDMLVHEYGTIRLPIGAAGRGFSLEQYFNH